MDYAKALSKIDIPSENSIKESHCKWKTTKELL